MQQRASQARRTTVPDRDAPRPVKEPPMAQVASFVDLFVWLLVLKSFFLPLFIIPTGSMAETLAGAHAVHACPNCGYEYQIGPTRTINMQTGEERSQAPPRIHCPNCRWIEATDTLARDGVHLRQKAGDRIMVHGWPYVFGGWFGPQRWDVVVFKNPNEPDINYIKRLIGLPNETIEIINGDIFVQGPDDPEPRLAQKPRHAQEALWFPSYNHDYLPRKPSDLGYRLDPRTQASYYPRWVSQPPDTHWRALETRAPVFDGVDAERSEIVFVTRPTGRVRPGEITDTYGYNEPQRYSDRNTVTDVRLSTDVTIEAGEGFVELILSKHETFFFARVTADGLLSLELADQDRAAERVALAPSIHVDPPRADRPARLALSHADGVVSVAWNREIVLRSDPEIYAISRPEARRQEARPRPSWVKIAAERVRVSLAHLRIDRDVHYESTPFPGHPGNGVSGHPIQLGPDAYFVLGDNSPSSADSRRWTREDLGPHLWDAYEHGDYTLGTVPADQMIGRAFLVYWPGFLPLTRNGPNILPDIGRVRWIH